MLYGHVETYEERVDHLLRLRELQDETGGFLAFVPLAFHPENTVFERRGWRHTTGADDLKVIAVSRLLLDNVPNIKAYWIMMGLPLAQVALHFGANDVQGTVVREEIFQAAGATAGTEQKIEELARLIREAGRIPVQRDTLYNELRRFGWLDVMLRLGRISYVNMAPVFFRLEAEVEEVAGVPTELNRQAARRRARPGADLLDRVRAERRRAAAPAAPLRLVRGRCRLDPARLAASRSSRCALIAVTPESATSVVLTKVLLPDAEHVPLDADADAKLLIGDAALRSAFEDPTPHHDLGRLWLERTGLPMVFAVWAAREPVAAGLTELEDALVASVRAARAEPEQLAHEAAERYGYPAGFLARYFEKLRYRFGPRERAGLYTFLELAHGAGELARCPSSASSAEEATA